MAPKIVTFQQSAGTMTYVRDSCGQWACIEDGKQLEPNSPLVQVLNRLVLMH